MSAKVWIFIFISISCTNLFGREVINGYCEKIDLNSKCIKNIENLLASEQRPEKKASLKKVLTDLRKKEVYLRTYFNKTEKLIHKFQDIDPNLFNEITFLKNKHGIITTVYIMVEPQATNCFRGLSLISSNSADNNQCDSPIGPNSVLIKINENTNNVVHLAHEFGHIKYIVPNYAQYKEYYHKHYKTSLESGNLKGHDDSDLSGHSAKVTVRSFCRKYKQCLAQERKSRNAYMLSLRKTHSDK